MNTDIMKRYEVLEAALPTGAELHQCGQAEFAHHGVQGQRHCAPRELRDARGQFLHLSGIITGVAEARARVRARGGGGGGGTRFRWRGRAMRSNRSAVGSHHAHRRDECE